ncbi:MAG TPA: aspartate/glutamate racemase family protein [Paracoccaceae bacterium]|nr:aspartate/glutamate racemase family protein [Paracoccaceae bacterium]
MIDDAMRGGRAGCVRRLLLINPNSNAAITAQVQELADRTLEGGVIAADAVGLPDAPIAIQSTADRALAEPMAIERIRAGVAAGYDGIVMACFDDIAISERGRIRSPVVDAVDSSLSIARTLAKRFAIITTFDAALPRIRTLISRHGLDGICSARAAGIGVTAAADLAPETLARLQSTIDTAIAEDGAEAIILGSGALAGRGQLLSAGRAVPVIDSIEAAIRLAAAAVAYSNAGRTRQA